MYIMCMWRVLKEKTLLFCDFRNKMWLWSPEHFCTNYTCLVNFGFLGYSLWWTCSVNLIYFLLIYQHCVNISVTYVAALVLHKLWWVKFQKQANFCVQICAFLQGWSLNRNTLEHVLQMLRFPCRDYAFRLCNCKTFFPWNFSCSPYFKCSVTLWIYIITYSISKSTS